MDGLFTGPPAERRRFLDRAVLAIDRQHGTRFNAFEKAMRGRNRLLSEPSPDKAWLAAIEAEMAELGVAIAAARREWTSLTAALIRSSAGGRLSPPPRSPSKGRSRATSTPTPPARSRIAIATLLGTERTRDAAAGRTLFGPHLSDLLVRHGRSTWRPNLLDRRAEGAPHRPRPRPGPPRGAAHRRDAGHSPRRDRRPSRRDAPRAPSSRSSPTSAPGLHDRHRRIASSPPSAKRRSG